MSLLMQALKKAERAKQHSGDMELEKPSEAFDELLALTPQEPSAATLASASISASAPVPQRASAPLSTPFAPLSLEPMDTPGQAPTADAPAPSAPPVGATLDFDDDGLPPIPVLRVAQEAIHDPVPPQARHHAEPPGPAAVPLRPSERLKADLRPDLLAAAEATAAAATAATYTTSAQSATTAGYATNGTRSTSAANTTGARSATAANGATPAPAQASARPGKNGKSAAGPNGAAARARAAAAAAAPGASSDGMDPAKIRIAVLCGVVLLIVLGYAYYFWQAVNGPGSGSRLPMVPMPPPSATGATPAVVVVPTGGAPAADAAKAEPPPEEHESRDSQRQRDAALAAMSAQLASLQTALQQQQQRAYAPDTLPPVIAVDNSEVRVAHSAPTPQVDPTLSSGYEALSNGDLATAGQQYDAALRQDPNNRDALLGAAAIALRQGQKDKAGAIYSRLLELDANDGDALAGLSSLRPGDPSQSEQRLQAALRKTPDSGPVLFALGNLYARQGRWAEAQQSYFRAYSAAPTNADYAFNLAIGLDRLNQSKLALSYYQKALALAQDKPASFDRDALRRRLQELNAASAR